jgi:hypothetical protein
MKSTAKTFKLFFSLAIVMILAVGCLPSYYPLFTPDQYLMNEELLGTWKNDDGTFIFEADSVQNSNRYLMTQISADGDTAQFYAALGKLDDHYFLDLSLRDLELGNTWAALHVVPVHTFSKITFDDSEMEISMFRESWLKKRIKQRHLRIKHEEKADGDILLTAPTEELQKFVIKYADIDEAYVTFDTLIKQSDS